MNFDFDSIVVGAGVVGLAIARSLSESGRDVLVLEANSGVGQGISSRNSEVIHAGIYYPFESLKRRLCLEGRKLLVDYCISRKIEYKMLGKLIVANTEQDVQALPNILASGIRNGVSDLRMIGEGELRELEPNLRARRAIHSPSTGIVDSHGLMIALQGDIERTGGVLSFNSEVAAIKLIKDGFSVGVKSTEFIDITCKELINSAGLSAQELSKNIIPSMSNKIPKTRYCKGTYFSMSSRSPFSSLIYPVPNNAGLGVHLTLDLAGRARFGPDTEWIDEPNYDVNSARKFDFVESIRDYFPGLKAHDLHPDYAGVRPKIVDADEPSADFSIQSYGQHSIPGYVALYGIESPGLTSALAIAKFVLRILGSRVR